MWFPHPKSTMFKNKWGFLFTIPSPSWNDASKTENPENNTWLEWNSRHFSWLSSDPKSRHKILTSDHPHTWARPLSSISHWCYLDTLSRGEKALTVWQAQANINRFNQGECGKGLDSGSVLAPCYPVQRQSTTLSLISQVKSGQGDILRTPICGNMPSATHGNR